ncbi:MAG: sigma-70 family RNA polymerase sigma factor [Pseudomonadota bacterium]
MKKSETISAATLDSSNSSDEAEEHSGDVCAKTIRTLYEQHSPVLIAALRKDFGDGPPDPEDIAHQAFQKIIERAKLSEISDVPGFLWRTARNLVLTDKRAQSVRSRHAYVVEQLFFPQEGSVSTPETVFNAKQQLDLINAVLLAMPNTRRRIFMMHRVEGLKVADIARRLRMSRPGAAKHLARAVADIDEALKAQMGRPLKSRQP